MTYLNNSYVNMRWNVNCTYFMYIILYIFLFYYWNLMFRLEIINWRYRYPFLNFNDHVCIYVLKNLPPPPPSSLGKELNPPPALRVVLVHTIATRACVRVFTRHSRPIRKNYNQYCRLSYYFCRSYSALMMARHYANMLCSHILL